MEKQEKAVMAAMLAVIMVMAVVYFVAPPPIVGYVQTLNEYNQMQVELANGARAPRFSVDNIEVQFFNAQGQLLGKSDSHNAITTTGQNFVRCWAAQGQTANSTCTPAINIMVFNDSAYTPSVNDYKCDPATPAKVENSYGIGPQAGAYVAWSPATAGKYNVSATFTLASTPSGAQTLYGACLTTSTTISGTNLFAAGTFSSTATVTAAGDYCKVIWTITPS
jgi:hypothetical protein